MESFFRFIIKWFWAIAIILTFTDTWRKTRRAAVRIRENPEMKNGYRLLIAGDAVTDAVPFLVMGAGILFGGVPSVFHYLNPSTGDPFVLSFYASVALMWLVEGVYLFFLDGAKAVADRPELILRQTLTRNTRSPRWIKALWVLSLIGGCVAFYMLFTNPMDVALPKFLR